MRTFITKKVLSLFIVVACLSFSGLATAQGKISCKFRSQGQVTNHELVLTGTEQSLGFQVGDYFVSGYTFGGPFLYRLGIINDKSGNSADTRVSEVDTRELTVKLEEASPEIKFATVYCKHTP